MDIHDAAHRVGHESPGGVAALAPRMGMGVAVLNQKINPNVKSHILSIGEMVRMEQMTGRTDMLVAHAEALGYVAIPVPSRQVGNVAYAITTACAEFGDYLRTVNDAMEDGDVSPNDVRRLEKELVDLLAAATHLQALLISSDKKQVTEWPTK